MNNYLRQKITLLICVSMQAVAVSVLLTVPLVAQDTPVGPPGTQVATEQTPAAATNTDELRKAAQNPVASLISVPVRDNSNFNITPGDRTQNVLNIQPVIPVRIGKNWNLITRIITPIVYQPLPSTEGQITPQGLYGLGDMNPTFFLSPAKPGKVIRGVGPAVVLPTATSVYLGQGKWSMGPSVVILTQPGHWTLGALVNNVWSFAGHSDRQNVDQMLFQYFINYNLRKALHHLAANHYGQLGDSLKSLSLDGASWWGHRPHHEARVSARQSYASVLRQSNPSAGNLALGDAHANCLPVSQTNQGAAENVDGTKAKKDGAGATAKTTGEAVTGGTSKLCQLTSHCWQLWSRYGSRRFAPRISHHEPT